MHILEFQEEVMKLQGHFPVICQSPLFMALELVTETAEAGEKMKKIVRLYGPDVESGMLTDTERYGVAGELGDALCCLVKLASWLEVPIADIQAIFLTKMDSRIKRNVQLGSGDAR